MAGVPRRCRLSIEGFPILPLILLPPERSTNPFPLVSIRRESLAVGVDGEKNTGPGGMA